jgi:hypothetical protein
MRDTITQCGHTMISVAGLRQPSTPHVSHAEIAGLSSDNQDGQRCALLTTKSRKTCTRATVFNSSG